MQKEGLGCLGSVGLFTGLAVCVSRLWASVLTSEKPVLLYLHLQVDAPNLLALLGKDSVGCGVISCSKD